MKFHETHRKTAVLESLFNKIVFFCELYKISQSTFFYRTPPVVASVVVFMVFCNELCILESIKIYGLLRTPPGDCFWNKEKLGKKWVNFKKQCALLKLKTRVFHGYCISSWSNHRLALKQRKLVPIFFIFLCNAKKIFYKASFNGHANYWI